MTVVLVWTSMLFLVELNPKRSTEISIKRGKIKFSIVSIFLLAMKKRLLLRRSGETARFWLSPELRAQPPYARQHVEEIGACFVHVGYEVVTLCIQQHLSPRAFLDFYIFKFSSWYCSHPLGVVVTTWKESLSGCPRQFQRQVHEGFLVS